MFATRFWTGLKREKKIRARRVDTVADQVRQVLQAADQQLILMVRN